MTYPGRSLRKVSASRRALYLGLALAVAVGIGLVLAEGLLAWLRPQPLLAVQPGLYAPDPPGGYRLSPGYRGWMTNGVEFGHAVSVDEHGLRSTGTPIQDGDRVIMVLGDSFAFGWGVEDDEAFAALLPGELEEPAAALNAGLPGIDVPGAVTRYEHDGRRLRPDVVLLAIFTGNDLADARADREPIRIVDGLISEQDAPRGLRSYLYAHSHLVRLLGRAAGNPAVGGLRRAVGLGEPFLLRRLRYEMSIYANEPPEVLIEAEEATNRALARLADMCRTDGALLVAALLPSRIQLVESAWQGALRTMRLDPSAYSRSRPGRVFAGLLEEHSIPYVDLAPAFAEYLDDGKSLFFIYDRHLNATGHRLAAAEIGRFLSTQAMPTPRRGESALLGASPE